MVKDIVCANTLLIVRLRSADILYEDTVTRGHTHYIMQTHYVTQHLETGRSDACMKALVAATMSY